MVCSFKHDFKIKLLPLLFLYISIILITQTDEFWGDEGRYIMFATNLTHGYYSPRDNINLWNGPGYPIVLMPFVLLKFPLLTAKLFNALFLFLAILYIYRTLHLYMQKRTALFFSYLLGIYLPFLRYIHRLLTEPLTVFLVCGFIFHFCKLHQQNKKFLWIHLLIASFYVGYLALTKIFFGYVITVCLLLFLFLYLWKKKYTFKKTFLVYLFALLYCVPYLFYTYSLTGKIFYWGNSGGLSLYWMSTPYKDELGDWHIIDNFYKNHQKFFDKLRKKNLSPIELDEELKKQAIQNIINHPLKYFKNWIANVGRLLFNYPYTNTPQSLYTYFYIIPNMFLVVFCILCIYPSYVGRGLIPFEIYGLIVFGIISFGGSSLLSAYNRQFQPLVPVFFLWISFILVHILKIEIKK